MSNLNKISEKLIEATEEYGEKYPKHIVLEMKYLEKFDKHLLEASSQYGSQPLRDAATREIMRQEPLTEQYQISLAEINVLNVRIRSLTQISKNLISGNWNGD